MLDKILDHAGDILVAILALMVFSSCFYLMGY